MVLAVIWDVDGVLVDSLGLRLAGLRHAAESSGVSVPSKAELRRWLCHNPRGALQSGYDPERSDPLSRLIRLIRRPERTRRR